jgi:small subunit ribosomal protein S21
MAEVDEKDLETTGPEDRGNEEGRDGGDRFRGDRERGGGFGGDRGGDRDRGRFREDRPRGRDRDDDRRRSRSGQAIEFRPLEVPVINGNLEGAIRALKRKMNREGILKQLKLKRFHEKPSVRRKRKRKEAERRRRRLMRRLAKRMQQRKRPR